MRAPLYCNRANNDQKFGSGSTRTLTNSDPATNELVHGSFRLGNGRIVSELA